jgi:glycosyltransferase involved in cell wall biosynthesis
VALSEFGARLLSRRVPHSKLFVAPLSAVIPTRAEARPERRADAPVRFLFVGRLLKYKGLDMLAEAFAPLLSRQDWRLTIAGLGGADQDAAGLLSAAQVDAARLGWLSDGEIASLLDTHDVLLAPYRSATQSGVVAEALAQGMPVAASPVGALAEQIDHGGGGWLAAEASAPAFRRVIVDILDRPGAIGAKGRGALALAQRAWSADYWSWLERL